MSAGVVVIVRGTGSAGRRHLRAFGEHRGVEAVAYPVRPERVAALRAEGIPAIASLKELPGVRALGIVATDTRRHAADARELLSLGDVLIEKPLVPHLDDVTSLAQLAASLHRKVWVGYCLRFEPAMRRFCELLPHIGQVDAVRIECQSYLPDWRPDDHRRSYSARREDGGVLRDLSHELDYAVHIFGRPTEVLALVTNTGRLGIEAEEAADVVWRVPNGATVTLRLDYLSRHARRVMRAVGERGEIEWNGLTQSVALRLAGQPERIDSGPCTRDELFSRQAEAFLRCSEGGDAGPLATFEEGVFVAAVTDAAYTSAKTRRFEAISALPV